MPVGKYARAALTNLGVWASVQASLVRGENVRAALAFVETGRGQGGHCLRDRRAGVEEGRRRGRLPGVWPSADPSIPSRWSRPNADPDARDFLAFIEGRAAKAAFKERGFLVK